jgi:hypothetical protein
MTPRGVSQLDGEVVNGEPTRNRGPCRCGLDPVGMSAFEEFGVQFS